MDDLLFFRLQKSFPHIKKSDVVKLMSRVRITDSVVLNWARQDLLGVGNIDNKKIRIKRKTADDKPKQRF